MKNTKDLEKNEVIHIESQEDWYLIIPENSDCLVQFDGWGSKSCYHPFLDNYNNIDYYESKGYTIHKAKDFLPEVFKNGDYVYNSEGDCFTYIGFSTDKLYVVEDDNRFLLKYKKVHKENPKQKEAIEEIKALAEKFNINLKEI